MDLKDQMENFNFEMQGLNDNKSVDELEFSCENNYINRSNFTSSDGEPVFMEVHDTLNNLQSVGNCQESQFFLNPTNNELCEISELNKSLCGTYNLSTISQLPEASDLNSNWPVSYQSPFGGEPGAPNTQDSIASDSGFFNSSGGSNSQLILPDNVAEYANTDTFFIGDYTSPSDQLFQTCDQEQMSFMYAPITPIQHPSTSINNFSDVFINSMESQPVSTTIIPLTVKEDQIGQRTPSTAQQEVIYEERFFPDSEERQSQSNDENFAPVSEHAPQVVPVLEYVPQYYEDISQAQHFPSERKFEDSLHEMSSEPAQQNNVISVLSQNQCSQVVSDCGSVPNQTTYIVPIKEKTAAKISTKAMASKCRPALISKRSNWTAVVPRKHCVHAPDMFLMQPARTRKFVTARKIIRRATTLCLLDYFDTSSIVIPMIRERPRAEGKTENRRKQKLNVMPGAENPIFEVQSNVENEPEIVTPSHQTVTAVDVYPSVKENPYPDIEPPELEEIFKKKKKTASTAGTKRSSSGFPLAVASKKKRLYSNVIEQRSIQESSTSFEEKVSLSRVGMRQTRSKSSEDAMDSSSESDSSESESGKAQAAKSLKCPKCMKLFKTTRSLAIHTKRCVTTPRVTSPNVDRGSNKSSTPNAETKKLCKVEKLEQCKKPSSSINTRNIPVNESKESRKNLQITRPLVETKTRPRTRSQTKGTKGLIIASTSKKSK